MAHKRVLLLLGAALAIAGASVAVAQASTRGRSHPRYGHQGNCQMLWIRR
jgi:hypothetical protein